MVSWLARSRAELIWLPRSCTAPAVGRHQDRPAGCCVGYATAQFDALAQHPQRQVILFVDNDKAHQVKVVERLLDKHQHQIRVEFLAPYSPEYNPQEDIWQHLRRRVTHNHYFEQMPALITAVHEFHRDLQADPEQALRLTKKWARLIAT